MNSQTIYLDYAATTPLAPQVLEAMMPYLTTCFGNPSSMDHHVGKVAREGVETARQQVADVLHADVSSVVFTSGGTESNNLALKGVMHQHPDAHVVVSAIEHASVLDSARRLEREGVSVTYVNPNHEGTVTVEAVESAIQPNTKLVSVMWGNNEVGTINDIQAIATLCHDKGILVHSDAAQGVGHLAVHANIVDMLTMTGHKLYAPKGVGALVVKKEVVLSPIIVGGAGERGRRAGTLNVASIVGLGKACTMCQSSQTDSISIARDAFEMQLKEGLEDVVINGCTSNRLPHISSVQFEHVGPDFTPSAIQGVACSSGSACHSGNTGGSHVLLAMGLSASQAASTIRASFGRQTSEDDAKTAANSLISCVNSCRSRV